jgi:hypothetical protein
MLNTDNSKGAEDDDQQKLGVCETSPRFHENNSLYKTEFSALLVKMSIKTMEMLLTQQQKQLAVALWEACNYGGRPKPENMRDMEPIRAYYEWVLQMENTKQWKIAQKSGKLHTP